MCIFLYFVCVVCVREREGTAYMVEGEVNDAGVFPGIIRLKLSAYGKQMCSLGKELGRERRRREGKEEKREELCERERE